MSKKRKNVEETDESPIKKPKVITEAPKPTKTDSDDDSEEKDSVSVLNFNYNNLIFQHYWNCSYYSGY